jgi:hypothetical protein
LDSKIGDFEDMGDTDLSRPSATLSTSPALRASSPTERKNGIEEFGEGKELQDEFSKLRQRS